MRVPSWAYVLPLRLRSLLRRGAVEQDLDDELRDHLERESARQRALGLDAARARDAALRRFGGVETAKEACRDTRRVGAIDALRQDVKYALRTLRRAPGFTAVAVLTLALGIGVNTAIFSVVDGVLFAPLAFPAPDRLIEIEGRWPRGGVAAIRSQARTFDAAAYADGHAFYLRTGNESVRVRGALVSAELFRVLGAAPSLGRVFRSGEDIAGHDRVVILSHGLWRERFGADPAVVGRSLELDGVARTIVGVMPETFSFPSRDAALWAPFGFDPADVTSTWAGDYMPIVGRLRTNRAIGESLAEIRVIQERVRELFPWRMPADWNRELNVTPLRSGMVAGVRTRLLVLLGAVLLVLLTACANVANLTLARAATRGHEMGVRGALGASPGRLARQLITESVVLAAIGGLLGLLLATQGVAALAWLLPADTPRLDEVRINWRVLAYTGALTLLTGCLFGLAPVRHLRGHRLRPALDAGGRSGVTGLALRLRSALTIAEISCAVVLLIGALLLVRGLWTLLRVDPGFRAERVTTARITPSRAVCDEAARCLAFYRTLDSAVRGVPGVLHAGFVNTLPLGGAIAGRSLELEDYAPSAGDVAPLFWLTVVTPHYLDVMRTPITAGRGFTPADGDGGARVALISAASARRFWPRQSAVGKRVRFVDEDDWRTIVGIVADVRAYDLERSLPGWIEGAIYVPFGPHATLESGALPSEMTLTVRTHGDEAGLERLVRRAVAGVSRDVAVSDVQPMRSVVAEAVAAPAAVARLIAAFAVLALTLGSLGVYGVLSFAVSTLTREIGVRAALGASRLDIAWLVARQGAFVAGAGILIGVAAAAPLMRGLASGLYGVSPFDPTTYAAVTGVVAIVTLVACYVPARRAMRVDPIVALRQ